MMITPKSLNDDMIRVELRRAIATADSMLELACSTALGYPTTSRACRQRICDAINARAPQCQVVDCGSPATFHAFPANAVHPDEGGMQTCDAHLVDGMSHMPSQPEPDHWRVFPI